MKYECEKEGMVSIKTKPNAWELNWQVTTISVVKLHMGSQLK